MPEIRVATRPFALFAASGLALAAASAALGQSDPLSEPFPAVLELSDLDGVIGFALHGAESGDFTGKSVASAGDVNGDGLDDLIIGVQLADPDGSANPGSAYVIFGRAAGSAFPAVLSPADLDGTIGFRIDGDVPAAMAGYAVASAGDVNSDGVDDVIIGAPLADPTRPPEVGSAFVVFGRGAGTPFPPALSLANLDGSDGFRIQGVAAGDWTGSSVSNVGDVNNDGVEDIQVGAPRANPDGRTMAGSTYIVFGREDGVPFPAILSLRDLDGVNGFSIHGVDAEDGCGSSAAAAGDVNGDGIDDLIIGAPFADPGEIRDAGSSYIIFGRSSAAPFPASLSPADLDGDNGFQLDGAEQGAWSGWAVASAGDVNDDGVGDVIIGAERANPDGIVLAGAAYIVFGRGGGAAFPATLLLEDLNGTTGFQLAGVEIGDALGASVASAGDVNGDGIDDVVTGAKFSDPGGLDYAGSTSVVFGRARGSEFPASISSGELDGTIGFRLHGVSEDDQSGDAVAPAGDLNGDGMSDLIIGARLADPGGLFRTGSAYVIFGRRLCPPDLDADGALTIFDFLEFGNLFDLMDPRADFDGDGSFTIFDFLAFQNAFDAGC